MATTESDEGEPPASFDGPWNQPELAAARRRQTRIRIGDLPARAAPIGQPFVRGRRTLQAVLITPDRESPERLALRRAAEERAAIRHSPQPTTAGAAAPDRSEAEYLAVDERLAVLGGSDDQADQQRPHRRWPLIATGIAFVCSVGIPIALHLSAPHDSATPAPARPRPAVVALTPTVDVRAQTLAWVQQNLPQDAVIVADQTSAAGLRRAGFSDAQVFDDLQETPIPTVDYVVAVAADAPTEQTGPAGYDALTAASLPLASFGDGAATVREYFPAGLAAERAKQDQDAALRKQGGSELVSNRELTFDAVGRAQVAAGSLDLRAQNVLNLMAADGQVYVTVGAPDPAEAVVGQPIRSLVVSVSDPTATQTLLASMVAPFRPTDIATISDHKFRLTWNPAVAPVATVGQ